MKKLPPWDIGWFYWDVCFIIHDNNFFWQFTIKCFTTFLYLLLLAIYVFWYSLFYSCLDAKLLYFYFLQSWFFYLQFLSSYCTWSGRVILKKLFDLFDLFFVAIFGLRPGFFLNSTLLESPNFFIYLYIVAFEWPSVLKWRQVSFEL